MENNFNTALGYPKIRLLQGLGSYGKNKINGLRYCSKIMFHRIQITCSRYYLKKKNGLLLPCSIFHNFSFLPYKYCLQMAFSSGKLNNKLQQLVRQ